MAKYINDFSEDTVGGLPSNFSFGVFVPPTGSISDHWQVTAEASASGGKVLRFTGAGGGTNYNFPAIWDLVPSSEHQRARFRWRAGQNISDLRLFARSSVSDTVDEPTGYTLGVRGADLDINRYVSGSFSNFANDTTGYTAQTGTWYITETEVVGINPTVLRVKTYPENGTEPATWNETGGGPEGAINDSDATDIESGGFGLFSFDADAQVDIDWLVVTTAGEEPDYTAPTAPTITNINTTNEVTPGEAGTLTGTNLTNATGLNIGSEAQADFAVASATSVTFTGTRGGNPYNQDLTATLLSPDGNATITVQQVPEVGTFAVTAASPNTTDDESFWTGLIDTATSNPITIVDGDQAWIKNPNNLTNLAIAPDGTITADETGTFVAQIWLASEGVWGSDQTVSFTVPGGGLPPVTIDAIPPLDRLIAGAGSTNGRLVPILSTSRIATSSIEVGRRDTPVAPFATGLPMLIQAVRVRVEDFFATGAVTQIRMPSGTTILSVHAIVLEAFDLTGAASMRMVTGSGTIVSGIDFSATGWVVPTTYDDITDPTGARAVNLTLEPSDQVVAGTETTGDAFVFLTYCYR